MTCVKSVPMLIIVNSVVVIHLSWNIKLFNHSPAVVAAGAYKCCKAAQRSIKLIVKLLSNSTAAYNTINGKLLITLELPSLLSYLF